MSRFGRGFPVPHHGAQVALYGGGSSVSGSAVFTAALSNSATGTFSLAATAAQTISLSSTATGTISLAVTAASTASLTSTATGAVGIAATPSQRSTSQPSRQSGPLSLWEVAPRASPSAPPAPSWTLYLERSSCRR